MRGIVLVIVMKSVLALKINDRMKKSHKLQKILTGFSSIIKTRLGLKRKSGGVIILDLEGNEKAVKEFKKKIRSEQIKVQEVF